MLSSINDLILPLLALNLILTALLWFGNHKGFKFVKEFLGSFAEYGESFQKILAGKMATGAKAEKDDLIDFVENTLIPQLVPDDYKKYADWIVMVPKGIKRKWYPKIADIFIDNPERAMRMIDGMKGFADGEGKTTADRYSASKGTNKLPSLKK